MTSAHNYANDNAERFREELKDFLRIPSVGASPAHAQETKRAADWLADNFRRIGLRTEVIQTQRHPLVYAEWLGAGADAPTVLVYGHYDVQPASLEDGWDSDPFEPVERDGKIYARGASDDKGQTFIHVKAVESLLAADGKLPVNVRFIVEGEEEGAGSLSLVHLLETEPERLRADVCVISDTGMPSIDQPMITYTLRGGNIFELHVSGPATDLHSGMYGGSVHNPAQALAEILAQLHNPDGSVAVPSFYDDVLELDDEERAVIAEVAMPEAQWRAETGAPQPWGEAGYTISERIGARPTLEIIGMAGGYYGDGSKSIVPNSAFAKISCRLVPHQHPDRIFRLIKQHIERLTPPTVRSEIHYRMGTPAVLIDRNQPAMQAAIKAYEKGWGARPKFMRVGGGIPIVTHFQEKLGLPVILMGFGLTSDNLHAPNEHFTISMFHKGIDTSIHYLQEVAHQ